MKREFNPSDHMPGRSGIRRPTAISLDQAAEVAAAAQDLIKAGDLAWNRIRQLHPADIASIVVGLPPTSRDAMIRLMSPEAVARILRQMNPVQVSRFGARLSSRTLSLVLGQVHPQQALQTLRRLPIRRAKEVAEALEQPLPDTEFIAHAPDTAGSLMVAQFPTVRIDGRADEARRSLKALGEDRQRFTHAYVLDEAGQLTGQISMVDLALAVAETSVQEIAASPVATVTVDVAADECARLRLHYNLSDLPVVDGGTLVGVISAESLLSATVEQDTRQMLQVASVAGETLDGPLLDSVRTRLPWLTVNLATTFLAAATVGLFESTLVQIVVLAAFLLVVAGQGGIGGTQTLTLIVRSIALGS